MILIPVLILPLLAGCWDYSIDLGKGFKFWRMNASEHFISSSNHDINIYPDILTFRFNTQFIWGCTRKIDEDSLWIRYHNDYAYGYFLIDKEKKTVAQGMTKLEFQEMTVDMKLWSGVLALPEEECDFQLYDLFKIQNPPVNQLKEGPK